MAKVAKKKTSKRLATIAGKLLKICKHPLNNKPGLLACYKEGYEITYAEIKSLAASVLSQYESEQPKKVAKTKRR